jgi:hypothetical protein
VSIITFLEGRERIRMRGKERGIRHKKGREVGKGRGGIEKEGRTGWGGERGRRDKGP